MDEQEVVLELSDEDKARAEHIRQETAREAIHKLVAMADSNIVNHFCRELELLGEEPTTTLGYLRIAKIFSDMDHSGGSASVFIPTLELLLRFKNLTPLTDDPDEWVHHTDELWPEPGGVWQSCRDGEAFSNDGGKTYYRLSEDFPVQGEGRPIHKSAHRNPDGTWDILEKVAVDEDVDNVSSEEDAVLELCNAIRLSVEYVGTKTLPPIEGWSWYDALKKHAPEMAQELRNTWGYVFTEK